MIVADQDEIGGFDLSVDLAEFENRLIRAVGLAEISQILAAPVRVIGANLAFHPFEGVKLRRRAPRSQV